ncbi:hypothetical protein HYV69_04300 [Candidatus Uhrbacteria bacterium]|nr:hypothetical protein [Candidatus Uhrbacteria bacterium]
MFDLQTFSVPVSIFLIPYGLYMAVFIFYCFFNIYHLIRYGLYGFGLYIIITIFAGGTILLVSGSIFILKEYDWSQPIFLNNIIETYSKDLFKSW